MTYIIDFRSGSEQLYTTPTSERMGYLGDHCVKIADTVANVYYSFYKNIMEGTSKDQSFSDQLKHKDISEYNPEFPDSFIVDLSYEKECEAKLNEKGIIFTQRTIPPMTKIGNGAWEVVKGLGLSILSPLAALSVVIPGGIGFGLRSVLLPYNNEILCALPKGSGPRKVLEEDESLSILTCNVALSESEVMNTANGVLTTKDRVPAMAKFIKRKNPAILCLQEAFSSRTIYEDMIGPLQEGRYYVAMCARPAQTSFGGGLTSGLLVASKYPIEKVGFHPYETKSGIDGDAKKGVLAAILDLGGGRNICIANTHLQSGVVLPESMKGKSRKEIQAYKIQQRKDQLKEAKEFIDLFCGECEKDSIDVNDIILSGDYNTSRYETQEFSALDQACAEFDFPALEEEMMENTEDGRFKDLNVPDAESTFDEYFSHLFSPFAESIKDNKHLERENESGSTTGTTLDTESFSYKYFRQLIHIDVMDILKDHSDEEILEIAGLEKVIDDMMKTYGKAESSTQSLGLYYEVSGWDQETFGRLLRIVHEQIRLSGKTIYKKPECLDHILLRAKGTAEQDHIFSEKGYAYEIETPIGAPGPLSDHSSVWVELKQKDRSHISI